MDDFASGTQFEFTYAPGVSTEQIIGFEMAGEIWSSYLADDVTVRIHVESTAELPDEVIGAALPGKKKEKRYAKIYKKLKQDITSEDDQIAVANLPSEHKEFNVYRRFSVNIDGQELSRTKNFRVNNANSKALGFLRDNREQLDGYIVVNDLSGTPTVGWDYDALRGDGIQGNEIDFLSVAMHEVGHVLGFVSGIDDSDWLKVLTEAYENDVGDGKKLKNRDFKFASPLDLYRYSDSPAADGQIDLSFGGNPFFSIDGGNTKLGSFANGEYRDFGGDGYQASHWKQFSSQGIMDPVLPVGLRKDISNLDLTSMDVIGWDINTAAAPSWDEMYANALADAQVATIENRDRDVEKMIQESNYDARRPRGDESSIYSWQIGLWQYTTLDSTDVSEVVPMDEFTAGTDVDHTDGAIDNQPDLAESSTVEEDLSTDYDETAIDDSPTVEIDTDNNDDTENNSIDNQPELTEPLSNNDLSSDSPVTPANETEANNENTEGDAISNQSELVETPINHQDLDSDLNPNLDDSLITSDVDANDLESSLSDNQSDLIEPSDNNNYSSDSKSIFENENNSLTDEKNESIIVNYSDSDSELSDDQENYWTSDRGYWYLQDFPQFITGTTYYSLEQDSLIEYS